jgi:serine/threonine-protein kinase HipA
MATRELDLYLDGVLAGTARMSSAGSLTFAYDEAYLRDPAATPVSMSMPLDVREHKNRAILPYLQGLLPDNAQALASIATTYGVSASSPFAMLEHIGRDVAGALQFVPSGASSPDAVGTRHRVRAIDEEEIAQKLLDAIAEYRDGKPLTKAAGRFSLAGAQPKIALHRMRMPRPRPTSSNRIPARFAMSTSSSSSPCRLREASASRSPRATS